MALSKNANSIRSAAYIKKRSSYDEVYKMKKDYQHVVRRAFRKKYPLKDETVRKVIGCGSKYFQSYLKRSWRNRYGYEWNGEPCHIDHIIPLWTAETKEDVARLFHYKNLQLLKPEDNYEKGGLIGSI